MATAKDATAILTLRVACCSDMSIPPSKIRVRPGGPNLSRGLRGDDRSGLNSKYGGQCLYSYTGCVKTA